MPEEVLQTAEHKEFQVEYQQPAFHRRVLANLIDIVLLFLLFVAIFIPTNIIAKNSNHYKKSEAYIVEIRENCGLYTYNDSTKTYVMWPTYFDSYNTDSSDYVKRITCEESIDKFIHFLEVNTTPENHQKALKEYDDYRLEKTIDGMPYFALNEETNKVEIVETTLEKVGSKFYYKNIYNMFIRQNCSAMLTTMFPKYYQALRVESATLFFVEIPIAYTLACLLVYLVPPLIFRRGRQTIGKLIYKVGLIDIKTVLSPKPWKFAVRFLIVFLAELVLGFFTLGIPWIISFSLMAFSKRKQGFPDYMLGLMEIDTNLANIYFSKYEASILLMEERKKGIKFHMREVK